MTRKTQKMNRMTFLAFLLASALLLGGCMGKPSGGESTREGLSALSLGDYGSALTLFREAVDKVPAYRGMGIALFGLGRYLEAEDAFQTALFYSDAKMPETVEDLRLYLATAAYRQGDYDLTMEQCALLLADASSTDAAYLMGASCLKSGKEADAREYFDMAVSNSPEDFSLYLQIYECYDTQNLSAVGDEYLQTALGIPAQTSQEQYQVARIYYYLEQYEKARDLLMEGVEANYRPALELMGEIHLKLEDFAHARSMYERILENEGESPLVDNGLALCYLESGDYDTALSYIEKGLESGDEEQLRELRFNEIVAYERKLDFSTARVKAEAYMQLYPTDEDGGRELQFLNTRR